MSQGRGFGRRVRSARVAGRSGRLTGAIAVVIRPTARNVSAARRRLTGSMMRPLYGPGGSEVLSAL